MLRLAFLFAHNSSAFNLASARLSLSSLFSLRTFSVATISSDVNIYLLVIFITQKQYIISCRINKSVYLIISNIKLDAKRKAGGPGNDSSTKACDTHRRNEL
jgi:hypothetical protein